MPVTVKESRPGYDVKLPLPTYPFPNSYQIPLQGLLSTRPLTVPVHGSLGVLKLALGALSGVATVCGTPEGMPAPGESARTTKHDALVTLYMDIETTPPLGQEFGGRDLNDPEKKRQLSDSENESYIKQRKVEEKVNAENMNVPTPLYLIVSHKDESKTLTKVSPFLINKAFVSSGGQPKSVSKLRNGTILVEAANYIQARKFLQMTSFFDQVEVVVQPHSSLNTSKGSVVRRISRTSCSVKW
ncbi:hypothetical protein J6590_095449 [Homalodisca vitripennis]|nr:hypothetical protein J6590_095449 [Homalodisca vitripennis]